MKMQLGNRNINDNLQNRGVKYWMQYPLLIKKQINPVCGQAPTREISEQERKVIGYIRS